MASLEFLQNRIAGKEKELAKLQVKMERILKAQATNWENNPYYYGEDDIRRTNRDIDDCKKALEDYKQKLQSEVEKANSRNIPAILEFLEGWKTRVKQYYMGKLPEYIEAKKEYYRLDSEYCNWFNYQRRGATPEEIKARSQENRDARKEFLSTWNWLTPYLEHDELNMDKLQKDLDQDANAKYDFIVERTNAIVGEITDATHLSVGRKGDLNGFIIGTKGKAKVETIGAGGYNIQCFHFRTLINRMK